MPTQKLPARLHLLSVREVQTATDGDHFDGGGLVLRVRARGATWVLRYTSNAGCRREMGLGLCNRSNAAAAGKSLTAARALAQSARDVVAAGGDPIDARDAAREAARQAGLARRNEAMHERATLVRVARKYHERVIEPDRTDKHAAQWIASLERNVPETVWTGMSVLPYTGRGWSILDFAGLVGSALISLPASCSARRTS